MNKESFIACELSNLDKLKKFHLPNKFKKIGFILFMLSLIALFLIAFTSNNILAKQITKYGILIGLFIISISKEKIEDEFVVNLRMQSYAFAFLMGIIYAIVLPFLGYLIDLFTKSKITEIKNIGDFSILWMLLFVQVFFFHFTKRLHK